MLRPVELVRGGIAFGEGKFSETITAASQSYLKDTRHLPNQYPFDTRKMRTKWQNDGVEYESNNIYDTVRMTGVLEMMFN